MMTKSLCCVSSKVISLPYYDGLTNVDKFLDAYEREVPEKLLPSLGLSVAWYACKMVGYA